MNWTDETVISSIISAGAALLGAFVGGIFAYYGSVQGAKKQIEEQRNKIKEEKLEREKLAESIATTFLLFELRHNYLAVNKKFGSKIIDNDKPFQHGYTDLGLKFEEFNKIKYDLIKHESKEVKNMIELYHYIMVIDSMTDMNHFIEGDYVHFRRLFLEYRPVFIGSD